MTPLTLAAQETMLKAYRPPPADDGGPHFMFDGKVLTRSQFECFLIHSHEPVIVAGSAIEEKNLVYLFDTHEAFEFWARKTYYAKAFARTEELVYLHRNENYCEEAKLGITVVSNTELEDENEAAIPEPSLKQRPSALLYEGMGYTGRSVTLGVSAIADLNEFEFADSVCSAKTHGVLMLTDEVNFGGYRFYITGAPFIEVPDLGRWGFNKSARSAIVC